MIQEGQMAPLQISANRPAFRQTPPRARSSKTPRPVRRLANFDVIVGEDDADFETSGLKTDSVIRVSRLAVVSSAILLGSIGTISEDRLSLIRNRILKWIQGA
jgi:hypothetical protein